MLGIVFLEWSIACAQSQHGTKSPVEGDRYEIRVVGAYNALIAQGLEIGWLRYAAMFEIVRGCRDWPQPAVQRFVRDAGPVKFARDAARNGGQHVVGLTGFA